MASSDPRSDSGSPTVGVALAGGQSRRMGRDKAPIVLPGEERSLLRSTVDRLAAVCAEVLVADAGRGFAESFAPDALAVADGPGEGPAAGILGAASVRPGRTLLVLACDLPRVDAEFLERLVERSTDRDLVVPVTPRGVEPLCALYAPAALEALARRVAEGRLDLVGLLDDPALRIERLDAPTTLFTNLNRPADLERLAAMRHFSLRGRSRAR